MCNKIAVSVNYGRATVGYYENDVVGSEVADVNDIFIYLQRVDFAGKVIKNWWLHEIFINYPLTHTCTHKHTFYKSIS